MSSRIRAAVIGLGQVGWRFDEEPGRRAVWTHVGAYKALAAEFELAGVCDVSAAARQAFSERHCGVSVFAEIAALIRETSPEVVSICTPNTSHRVTLDAILSAGRPSVIWCEKPLAISLADANAMVNVCNQAQASLVVSHARRWSPLWQRFRARLDAGDIGTVRCLRIAMPNRLWSIGSHAADLLLWLGGPAGTVRAMPVPALDEGGEPAIGALMTFESGALGILQVTGFRSGLIVEAEAIGDAGRMTLREDTGDITLEPFAASPRYERYRELAAGSREQIGSDAAFSPFVAIAREAAGLARGTIAEPTCSGRAALATQDLLEQLAAAAMPNSRVVTA